MKKLLLLAVSLAFIASIGVGGTLAFRTYLITNHSITDGTAAPSAEQSPAPLAMQVSNGGTLADFNVRARGVRLLGSDDDVSSTPNSPTGSTMTIKQHTYQREADGDLKEVPASEATPATRTILTQLLPSPAFQSGKNLPGKDSNGCWNNVGAVDHVIKVSYSYTSASEEAAPKACIRTIFAFPNPTLASCKPFMDSIYLNWQNEEKLSSFDGKKYIDLTIDDLPYRVFVYEYDAISSGSDTDPSLLQVAMDAAITSKDIEKLAPYDGFAVKIVSQAITNDAGDAAKEAVFYTVNQSSHPWTDA